MHSIPYYAKREAGPIADACRDENKDRRAADGERLDDINGLDEVDPEQKIDHGLRHTKGDQGRPQQVPTAEHRREPVSLRARQIARAAASTV